MPPGAGAEAAAEAGASEVPLALTVDGPHGRVLHAVNGAAEALGLHPGLPLSEARARHPGLRLAPADPAGDAEALLRLARWCGRYSPWVRPEPPDGIVIDASGCAHLWGGEAAMLADLGARLGQWGVPARLAMAETLGAAMALTWANPQDAAQTDRPDTASRRGRKAPASGMQPLTFAHLAPTDSPGSPDGRDRATPPSDAFGPPDAGRAAEEGECGGPCGRGRSPMAGPEASALAPSGGAAVEAAPGQRPGAPHDRSGAATDSAAAPGPQASGSQAPGPRAPAASGASRAGGSDSAAHRRPGGQAGPPIVAAAETAAALAPLPVAALRLEPRVVQALHRLGLKRIGELYDLPRAALVRRFGGRRGGRQRRAGEAVRHRLDQALGLVGEPVVPLAPPPAWRVRRDLAEPVTEALALPALVAPLVAELVQVLGRAGQGAQRVSVTAYGVDGGSQRVGVGAHAPTRDADHLNRLLAERLGAIDPGFGLDALSVAADAVAPLGAVQADLDGRTGERLALGALIDRLSLRLGPGHVGAMEARASHVPERAEGRRPGALPTPWQPADALGAGVSGADAFGASASGDRASGGADAAGGGAPVVAAAGRAG
ncbi:hypothetical protein CCR80_00010, partial [Rhodothalassium salexigens]|nr:hypothetical protein [Rhodothalassium salexigens]